MNKVKNLSESRAWLRSQYTKNRNMNEYGACSNLSTLTIYMIAKYIGLTSNELYMFMIGRIKWPATIVSKFIDEWESGILYINADNPKKRKICKRKEKQKQTSISIDLSSGKPALFVNRPIQQQGKQVISKFSDFFGKRG